jgi:hypothetical protein
MTLKCAEKFDVRIMNI